MTFLQSGDQIPCVVSGRVMKALEADRVRAALNLEQLIQALDIDSIGCLEPYLPL